MAKRVGASKAETSRGQCPGGLSLWRNQAPHELGKVPDIVCYRCKARMGCSSCCQIPSELICGRCQDWATRAGFERHGAMVRRQASNA